MSFEFFKFPAGEVHCKDKGHLDGGMLYVPYEGGNLNDYFMQVIMAASVKRRKGQDISLFLPYLPYSRQDRPTSEDEPFSLKVIGDILNLQGFKKVITLDVHSDAAYACVDNLVNIGPENYIRRFHIGGFIQSKTLIIPDQGVYKRLTPLFDMMQGPVVAIKKRNTDTGHLELKHVIGDVEDKSCLIVDDIADGGMTFILLAEELYKLGAKTVDLMVTHGILSKGTQPLEDAGINNIYTTNSFFHYGSCGQYLHVLDCLSVLADYQTKREGTVDCEY